MADFYAGSSLEFWVPDDHSFPADPAIVIQKVGYTPPITHPSYHGLIDHPGTGAEIMHSSVEHCFVKTMAQSPVIHVAR